MDNSKLSAPRKVDLLLTAGCPNDCRHCIGPKRSNMHIFEVEYLRRLDEMPLESWIRIIEDLHDHGTEEIVFSGGEPTLYSELLPLVIWCKDLGIKTTLSTNAQSDIEIYEEVLLYIDEIGISLDASTDEINMAMGKPKGQKELVVDLILEIQKLYPNVEITVRTVLTRYNQEDIEKGNVLKYLVENGVDMECVRWKVYDLVPNSEDSLELYEPKEEVNIPEEAVYYPLCDREPYIIIYPNGDVALVDTILDENIFLSEVDMGNMKEGWERLINSDNVELIGGRVQYRNNL